MSIIIVGIGGAEFDGNKFTQLSLMLFSSHVHC